MTYRYSIPAIPPSNNQYIGRTNFREYQRVKKDWAQLVKSYCRPVPPLPLERARVTLLYHFRDRRRRDPDNYSGKMLLDGLVAAGILRDDSFRCVELVLRSVCDGTVRTEIILKPTAEPTG